MDGNYNKINLQLVMSNTLYLYTLNRAECYSVTFKEIKNKLKCVSVRHGSLISYLLLLTVYLWKYLRQISCCFCCWWCCIMFVHLWSTLLFSGFTDNTFYYGETVMGFCLNKFYRKLVPLDVVLGSNWVIQLN